MLPQVMFVLYGGRTGVEGVSPAMHKALKYQQWQQQYDRGMLEHGMLTSECVRACVGE